jgi:hypothetical protein
VSLGLLCSLQRTGVKLPIQEAHQVLKLSVLDGELAFDVSVAKPLQKLLQPPELGHPIALHKKKLEDAVHSRALHVFVIALPINFSCSFCGPRMLIRG